MNRAEERIKEICKKNQVKKTNNLKRQIQNNMNISCQTENKLNRQKGITLIALIVTIIVLLILAGITISTITSDNGIIKNALSAKERTEIAQEIEIVEQATIHAMGNNRRGNIVKNELQEELDKITGEGETIVTNDTEDQGYFVKFVDSGRIYKVSIDGDVSYLGKEEELITQAEIIASPESDTTAKLIQQVDLTVKTPIEIEGAEYSLVYAWNQDKENAPDDTKFLESTLIGDGRRKTTTVYSSDTVGGDYYLWVKVVVGEIEREECFGPYTIRDHTTLVATSDETDTTSGFLGNTNIQRRMIESVNIATSLSGHSTSDENTWDVSEKQDGMYLAWYEDNDNDGYYEVTIAGEGGVVANSNSSYLFKGIGSSVENQEVRITGIENLETGLTTNMDSMFRDSKVRELNLNKFNTSNVTSMQHMFSNCSSIEILDVSNFDTSKVKSLEATFAGCTNLATLEVNNWDTSNVVKMGTEGINAGNVGTFQNCSKLTQLDLSKWDTSNVTAMGGMFRGCSSLVALDINNFNTSKVTCMYGMFSGCTNLQNINVKNFNTSNVTIMQSMFNSCSSLSKLDLSRFDTSNVTNIAQMFSSCAKITELDLSNFNTSKVKDMSQMFINCSSLTKLDVSEFNTITVTSMSSMFKNCSNLKELDVTSFDTSNVKNMTGMFWGCTELINLYMNTATFNTSNVTNMSQMFNSCRKLSKLDVSKFDTSKVENMGSMFNSCSALTEIDVSNFDTSNVTDMGAMFRECSSLSSLDLSKFNTDKVTNMWYMFYSCRNLKKLNISDFNTQNVTNWESMFTGIPTTIQIITNQNTKDWILDKFPNYTNIITGE